MKTEQNAATQHDTGGDFTQSLLTFLHERGKLYLHRQVPVTDGFARHVILPQTEEPTEGITAFLAQATLWGSCMDDNEDWRGRIVHPDVVLLTCADDEDRLAYYAALASRGLVKATMQIPASLIVHRQDCLDGLAILFATFTQKTALPEQLPAGAAARHGYSYSG